MRDIFFVKRIIFEKSIEISKNVEFQLLFHVGTKAYLGEREKTEIIDSNTISIMTNKVPEFLPVFISPKSSFLYYPAFLQIKIL